MTCSFCFQIMYLPVIIQPCNHRFCGGCLTDLVNSKKDACIQCRKEISTSIFFKCSKMGFNETSFLKVKI